MNINVHNIAPSCVAYSQLGDYVWWLHTYLLVQPGSSLDVSLSRKGMCQWPWCSCPHSQDGSGNIDYTEFMAATLTKKQYLRFN